MPYLYSLKMSIYHMLHGLIGDYHMARAMLGIHAWVCTRWACAWTQNMLHCTILGNRTYSRFGEQYVTIGCEVPRSHDSEWYSSLQYLSREQDIW